MLHILYMMSLAVLNAYTAYAVRVCGVPCSLSDMYYQLKIRGRPSWLFQVAMIVPSMLLMPVWIECSPESLQRSRKWLFWAEAAMFMCVYAGMLVRMI